MVKSLFEKIDAVVLAGTHLEKDKLIFGQNKSFLDFHGKPVVQWVIEALSEAQRIDRIVVVGPLEKINAVRERADIPFLAVEQRGQMLQNAWVAFLALCPQGSKFPSDMLEYIVAVEEGKYLQPEGFDAEKPYLYITGDAPLTTAEAVDDFIERCSQIPDHDMYYGVTDEDSLKAFYPTPHVRGIKRPYVNFADERLRVSNIQIIKPLKMGRFFLVQAGYSARKLKKWSNIFRVMKVILRYPYGMRAVGFIAVLQMTALLHKYGLHNWARPLENRCRKEKLEWYISHFLQTRFVITLSPFGGMSLDIDDVEDYEILLEHFENWRVTQQKKISSGGDVLVEQE